MLPIVYHRLLLTIYSKLKTLLYHPIKDRMHTWFCKKSTRESKTQSTITRREFLMFTKEELTEPTEVERIHNLVKDFVSRTEAISPVTKEQAEALAQRASMMGYLNAQEAELYVKTFMRDQKEYPYGTRDG